MLSCLRCVQAAGLPCLSVEGQCPAGFSPFITDNCLLLTIVAGIEDAEGKVLGKKGEEYGEKAGIARGGLKESWENRG